MNRSTLALLAALPFATLLPPSPAETTPAPSGWPAFRGNGHSRLPSGADIEKLPLTWSATENLAWRVPLPGYGQSSPVVWNRRVFATAVEGDLKETLHLAAFDLADGKPLWSRSLPASQQIPFSNMVSKAAPTPAVDPDRVYAFFESGDLAAFSHTGRQLWTRSLTADFGPLAGNHGIGGSLALAPGNGLVLLVDHDAPSYLLKVDRTTGKTLWKNGRPARVSWSSPIVAGDTVYLSSNGVAQAFDLRSGDSLWSVDGIRGNTVASPSLSAGRDTVVIGSSDPQATRALDARTGAEKWRTQSTSSFGSPLVHNGRVYLVSRAGVVHCHDLEDGALLWEQRLPASCWSSPVAAGNRLYFFSKNGITTVFDAQADDPAVLAVNDLALPGGTIAYGVAFTADTLVLRTGSELIALRNRSIHPKQQQRPSRPPP